MNMLVTQSLQNLPAVMLAEASTTQKRYIEFFAANIRNKNTRAAYLRCCTRFLSWSESLDLKLNQIEVLHVAMYIEQLSQQVSAPTVKQHLAALRMLFDWMVIGQCMKMNPTAGVRGPRHVYQEGKTPVLDARQTRKLFDSIDGERMIDYRDRAIIALMIFSFARISAVVQMKVKDYVRNGSSAYFNFHEKGGKNKRVPAHHLAAYYIEQYINRAHAEGNKNDSLFLSAGQGRSTESRRLSGRPIHRINVLHMIKRRALKAGLSDELGCHTFRGTGITLYLENDGDLDTAAWIAGHASTRTTKLYDRRKQVLSQSEIERIRF